MTRSSTIVASAVVALVLARGLGCSPDFEFTTADEVAGAAGSLGGTLSGAGAGGEGGAGLGLGAAAGESPTSTDVGTGGTGEQPPGVKYDTGDEDCTNGIDDDDDGAADCQDDDCQPYYQCLAPVPEGWQGPIALWEGSETSPSCTQAGYYPVGIGVVGTRAISTPEPSTCPTCTCEPAQGATCTTVEVSYHNAPDCAGDATVVTAGETCSSQTILHDGVNIPVSATFIAPSTEGTCTPVEMGARSTPPVDRMRTRSCGGPSLDGVGCGDSELCLPRPLSPFNAAVCIFIEGDAACPEGYDEPTETYYTTVDDSRACQRCACNGPRCTGVVSDHMGSADCDGASTEIAPGECVSIEEDETDPNTRSLAWDVTVATCTARSGPTGTYRESDPLTFCCYQY
jgi:hypothetical protein